MAFPLDFPTQLRQKVPRLFELQLFEVVYCLRGRIWAKLPSVIQNHLIGRSSTENKIFQW